MLSVKDEKYNDIKLSFSEEGHSYKDSLGHNYISTTTILHSYQPKFDKKVWLTYKAKELGISAIVIISPFSLCIYFTASLNIDEALIASSIPL